MHMREWFNRLFGTLRPRRPDEDLEAELRAHLELSADDERRRGDVSDAERAATIRHGAMAQSIEALRDQRGLPWLDDLQRDVRHGLRTLRRTPTFTAIALLTLAIGVGANTAVFSVVNGVLLKPLPYPHPEDLVGVWHSAAGAPGLTSVSGDLRLSASMYFTYAEQNQAFAHIGIWFPLPATVTGVGEPEQVRSVMVSDGVLQALAVPPLAGRSLQAVDQAPDAAQVLLLGYGYWQRRFGGDRGAVGRSLQVNGSPREIVGVMPKGFRIVDADADIIVPARFDRAKQRLPGFGYVGVARLKPGATIADASADIARLVPIWMTSWPAAPGVNPRVYEAWKIAPALRPLKQDVVGKVGDVLWVLMGTLAIVMLIVCANVATLVLVRAESRHQELAVRSALGAGSGRIVRSLLVESLLLGMLGGGMGLAIGYAGVRAVVANAPDGLPRLDDISVNGAVFSFTFAVSLISGVIFGLIPAIKHSSPQIAAALGTGSRTIGVTRSGQRARNVLVVAQLALALVLLVSSGLMIRTFSALRAVQPGFAHPESIQVVRIAVPGQLVPEPERVVQLQRDLLDKLATVPGVTSVTLATSLPMEGLPTNWDIVAPEENNYAPDEIPPLRVFKDVSPEYFSTMGTRLIEGRTFTWPDLIDRHPVAIVSDHVAREFWGTPAAAIGKRLKTLPAAPPQEVVGVVQDVYDNGVNQPAPTIVYWPLFGQDLYRPGVVKINRIVAIALRSPRAGTDAFLRDVHAAVWSINGNLSLASVRTMKDLYDRSLAQMSFTLVMLAIAGLMALVLGIVGIYGVIAYAVSQRTREIGIRVALGAQRAELTRMFVRSGLLLASVGVPLGLIAAVALSRLMSSLLFGVSPLDPLTYVAVPLVLLTAVVAASYLPARRAASVDPVDALKIE